MNELAAQAALAEDVLEPSTRFGINPRDRGFVDLSRELEIGRPLVLEIGSGRGRFIAEQAKRFPDRNFIGIEKSLHYYRFAVRKLERLELENARMVNFDAGAVLARMLPPSSVDEIHIYFPDPWPRKKRKKRRIARESHLRVMKEVMKPGARGVFVTDHRGYFEDALPEFERVFDVEAGVVDQSVEPRTNYEAKYRREGRTIYEISFRPAT